MAAVGIGGGGAAGCSDGLPVSQDMSNRKSDEEEAEDAKKKEIDGSQDRGQDLRQIEGSAQWQHRRNHAHETMIIKAKTGQLRSTAGALGTFCKIQRERISANCPWLISTNPERK